MLECLNEDELIELLEVEVGILAGQFVGFVLSYDLVFGGQPSATSQDGTLNFVEYLVVSLHVPGTDPLAAH